jgi:hypothetical protein
MNKPLDTELTLKTDEGATETMRRLSPAVMQALYYEVTSGRTEQIKQNFDDNFIVRIGDINSLIERVEQTIRQYAVKAETLTISVSHHERDKITFSSRGKFLTYDTLKPDPISTVQIKLNFLVEPPSPLQAGRPQNYTVRIVINSHICDERDRGMVKIKFVDDCNIASNLSIMAMIEYVDYIVARAILNTISEWTRTLEVSKRPLIASKHLGKAGATLRIIAAFIAANLIYAFVAFFDVASIATSPNIATAIIVGTFALFLVTMFEISNVVFNSLFNPGPTSFIILNKGDEKNYERFSVKRSRREKILWAVLTGGALSLIVALSARWIANSLGF